MLKHFLEFLKYEKRYSVNTIQSYEMDINQFNAFLLSEYPDLDIEFATYNHVRSWVVQLSLQDIQASSLKRKISSLKCFYKFLIRQGFIETNPADKIVTPKLKERLPKYIEQNNLTNLLEDKNNDEVPFFSNDYLGIQDKLIIDMLYQTGMRRQELIDLKWENIDFAQQQVKITGKGNKQRIVPCSINLLNQLKAFKALQADTIGTFNNSFIFLTTKGQQLYPNYVYRLVKDKIGKVSTAEKKSPHVLRHSFATHISNNGAKLSDIKELMGHASLASTQVYTHNTIEQLKEIYKNAHPKA